MRISVFLQDPFDYASYWIRWGLGLLAAALVVWLLWRYLPRLHLRIDLRWSTLVRKIRLFFRKRRSLRAFRRIETAMGSEALDARSAHQRICGELRRFAGAVTDLPIESMVYSELKETEYLKLADLIGEYYNAEFSLGSEEDVDRLLNLSKELVRSWQ